MKTRIGIFTASESLRHLLRVEAQMRELCDITYLPYSSMMELTNLYLEHAAKFDGFLFSGQLPYDYISKNVQDIRVPCRYLELADRDIYLLVARLYAQNPQINFNRVIFDADPLKIMGADERPFFEDVFPPRKGPRIHSIFDNSFYDQNLNMMYEVVMKKYREYWNKGDVDLVVTRLTNLAGQLEWEGIPYMLLQPSPATIMDCFRGLLNDIKEARLEHALTACCVIQIAHENATEDERKTLNRILEQFNSEQNMVFVLRQENQLFDAVTSNATARKLTSDYTTCLLTSYLYEALPFSTFIGWGIGYDIVTAHQNALRAIRESKADPHRYTYMVNESDEMIGPLCGDRTISYQLKPNARTSRIAKELGISAINLEKMISLQKNRRMTEFSASDLVFYLDITPRSATRILRKLTEYGVATQVNSLNLNGRGRPAAIYEIDFDKIEF